MNQSKFKLAAGIIILALIANGVFFILEVSKQEIVDPPKYQQIIIPETVIDTIVYDTISNKR